MDESGQAQTAAWLARLWRWRLAPRLTGAVPMLSLLGWLLAGSLPLGLVTMGLAKPLAAISWGLTLAAVSAKWLSPPRPSHLVVLGLGIGLAWLHAAAPWQTYRRLLQTERGAYVELEAIVVEDRLPTAAELAPLADTGAVRVKLSRLRLSRHEPWTACRGTVLLREPPVSLRYGQRIVAHGALVEPPAGDLPGDFDYRGWLRRRGIRHLLYPEALTVIDAEARGWRRPIAALAGWREAVLAKVVADETSLPRRRVLAAMTLGFRGGMEPEVRDRYLRSGMIHLFAISGLHVGIMYVILMALLLVARVPFAWRHAGLPLLLLVYVIAAGAAPSALRAWLMLTIWSWGSARFLRVVGINAVLGAAFVLLLLNPLLIFDSGFQFSFVIVLVLVASWGQGRAVLGYAFAHWRWIKEGVRRGGLDSWRLKLLRSLLAMSFAWLAGIGLSLWYNQLFLPMAWLTNLLVGVLAGPILALSVIKLLLLPVGLEAIAGYLLSGCLAMLDGLALIAAEHAGATLVARPPLAAVFGYYALLTLVLAMACWRRRFWVALTGLALYTAALVVLPSLMARRPAVTLLLSAASAEPVVVFDLPGRPGQPILINAGTTRFGYSLADWLRYRGVDRLSALVILHNHLDACGAAPVVLASAPARAIHLLADTRRNLGRFAEWAWQSEAAWRVHGRGKAAELPGVRIVAERFPGGLADYSCDLWDPLGEWRATLRLRVDPERGCTIDYTECAAPGDRPRRFSRFLPYANRDRLIDLRRAAQIDGSLR